MTAASWRRAVCEIGHFQIETTEKFTAYPTWVSTAWIDNLFMRREKKVKMMTSTSVASVAYTITMTWKTDKGLLPRIQSTKA